VSTARYSRKSIKIDQYFTRSIFALRLLQILSVLLWISATVIAKKYYSFVINTFGDSWLIFSLFSLGASGYLFTVYLVVYGIATEKNIIKNMFVEDIC
jgi:hypothetical protein